MSTRRWVLSNRRLGVWATWAAVLLAWEAAYRLIGWRDFIFPAPHHVFHTLWEMLWLLPSGEPTAEFYRSRLVVAVVSSSARLGAGFLISVALGLCLGLAMWRFKFMDALLGPLFLGLQTLPSVCWVPLAILTLGYNERSVVFVTVMGSFFAIAISLRDGLRATPPIYKAAGQVFGAQRWTLYRYVMLPAGLPALAGSLRSGFSFAWRSLMGGELLINLIPNGLGHQLAHGRDFGDVDQVIAVMAVMVAIGMIVDRFAFARIEHKVRERFGLTG